jgi:Predicted nucleotide-binding protein containing TIR-like domain
MATKPKVFIASSSKALDYATAIKNHINNDCEAYVWRDVEDYPSKTITDWVFNLASNYDFGIFVFSNDDTATIDNEEQEIVRDNVLFELGLFVGRLGFERCNLLRPNIKNFRLPSDLNGVFEKKFDIPERKEFQLISSELRVPCAKINDEIKKRWSKILEEKNKALTPERIAAICYRFNNDKRLYEFLLVKSSDEGHSRRGFPKKPFDKNENRLPIEVAIEVANEEGGVRVKKIEKAPDLLPFTYKKENKNTEVKYTPILLEVIEDQRSAMINDNKYRQPEFFPLGDVFAELRSNRNDFKSIASLERVICQCYEYLLKE